MAVNQRRRSTIGLDYGTHSTKVVHRIRDEELGRVVHFDDPCDGYPVNASPSAIREVNGRIYFGTRAIEMVEGENYGSLKADLLSLPDEREVRQNIEVLAATYIAWVLQSIFVQDEQLAADDPIVQFSAPTSHEGDEQLKQVFLESPMRPTQ